MKSPLLAWVLLVFGSAFGSGRAPLSPSALWQASDPGFRPIAITSHGKKFWACGVDEAIASSGDGQHWTLEHSAGLTGALLLGIHFSSDSFGYAYGTGGTLLTTENGGTDWIVRTVSEEPILMAALTDAAHGLLRTRTSLLVLNGDGSLHTVSYPVGVEPRFRYTEGLAALTQDRMAALLSEGPYSESGYLVTEDGGKDWTFYDPPSTGISSLVAIHGEYWTTGNEVVGKDKPGGGLSVPMAMTSKDGLHWTKTTSNISVCHWESCGNCTDAGCLASGTLMVNFYNSDVTYADIPAGKLTAEWASTPGVICTIHSGLFCAALKLAPEVDTQPDLARPARPALPPLGTSMNANELLRCLSCSLEPVYLDEKDQGQFKLHLFFKVREDGTIESAEIQGAPSPRLERELHQQILQWIFEPPRRGGESVKVNSHSDVAINVLRPR